MSCPETLGSILGFQFNPYHTGYEYKSVGTKTKNEASIYSGTYQSSRHPGKTLKYIVVVKQGTSDERGTSRAGNRGKRDSQLLLFGILNRMMYNRRPTELDLIFADALQELNLSLNVMEFLMAIDADTRVAPDAMKYFIHKMDNDKSVLACCGETQVDNKNQSLITMIQVFEYYSAHHMKKAFESVFGCVTCLPGCFTMYRLYTEDQQPLLCCDNVFSEYSRNDIVSLHERNLYELGEDRMLTTLMLEEFHEMQLSFVPEAVCWTIVPHNAQILLSQRRRWVNSTIHNMLELLKVKTMCGISFFSMKTIVIFDLVSTFLLPSGCVYLYYVLVLSITTDDPLTVLQIIAFVYLAIMTLPFVMRAEFSYFIHYIVFLIAGVPMFYFYLPMYAFWHMDDLSWGKTRQVKQDKVTVESGAAKEVAKDLESSDSSVDNETTGSAQAVPNGNAKVTDTKSTLTSSPGTSDESSHTQDEEAPPATLRVTLSEYQVERRSNEKACPACSDDEENRPVYEDGKLSQSFLPKVGLKCTCGKETSRRPESMCDLNAILRPWQVEFLHSIGVENARAYRRYYQSSGVLSTYLKEWRESKGLPSASLETYQVALHVWDRTIKTVSYERRFGKNRNNGDTTNDGGKSIASKSTAASSIDDGKSFASESQQTSSEEESNTVNIASDTKQHMEAGVGLQASAPSANHNEEGDDASYVSC